jgi:hypothetical protein
MKKQRRRGEGVEQTAAVGVVVAVVVMVIVLLWSLFPGKVAAALNVILPAENWLPPSRRVRSVSISPLPEGNPNSMNL